MIPTADDTALAAAVASTLAAIRARTPLVHNITNLVVTNSTANALLAIGASPAMVEAIEEVEEFAAIADALVINLGTMDAARAQAMQAAALAARAAGTPWVLDPVAVGAISFRSRVAVALLEARPGVIRGNGSEILALARLAGADSTLDAAGPDAAGPDAAGGQPAAGRGVDSRTEAADALDAARRLARMSGATVVISGATDYATDGARTMAIGNGHPMMTRVTGLGCSATALIGACLAVEPDPLAAAVAGMVMIGLAGEYAAETAAETAWGPGSLQVGILDALYALDADRITRRARVRRLA